MKIILYASWGVLPLMEKNKEVVTIVLEAIQNDGGCKSFPKNYIVHQKSLCGKCLDMPKVVKPVI